MDGMTESELSGLAASETAAKSHPDLPDGWVMKEVPRKKRDGSHSSHIDKYYYEPGTGKKFQSLTAAKKHVAASNEGNDLHQPLAKESRLKNQASSKKKRTEPSSSADLPEKDEQPTNWYDEVATSVNWVLQSFDEPHVWKAYINGREVPASVSREWQEEAAKEWHSFRSVRKFRKGSG